MKIVRNSDYYNPQIEYTSRCPKYNADATVTVCYSAKKSCKTDIQPTYSMTGKKCSLWDGESVFPCVECPIIPKDKFF